MVVSITAYYTRATDENTFELGVTRSVFFEVYVEHAMSLCHLRRLVIFLLSRIKSVSCLKLLVEVLPKRRLPELDV